MLKHFRFWCQKVLPLVYDDSLSYYEVLCKVVDYINKLINSDNEIIGDIDELRSDLETVQEWINNFNYDYIKSLITDLIPQMVYFGLTDSGYFVVYIPESWEDISFATTGYDITEELQPEYGHLVLRY